METGMGKEFWVGVDLSEMFFDAGLAPLGLRPDAWATVKSERFELSRKGVKALATWLAKTSPQGRCVGVCVEAMGSVLRRFMALLDKTALPKASVVNPARVKAFRDSLGVVNKTDRIDAALLAVFGAVRQPPVTVARSKEQEALRALTRLREDLVQDRTAWKNREREATTAFTRRLCRKKVKQIEAEVGGLEEELRGVLETAPEFKADVERLQTIPGVGFVLAVTLVAELGDLRAYRREELVALTGLYPKVFESGTSVRRRPHLARGGGASVRRVLFMAALGLKAKGGCLKAWAQALEEKGKTKMCTVGALMRKLLLIARAVLCKNEDFSAEKFLGKKGTAADEPTA
jgi:transposase